MVLRLRRGCRAGYAERTHLEDVDELKRSLIGLPERIDLGGAPSRASARPGVETSCYEGSVASYNDDVIAEFRAHGGKVGGRWEGRTLLLLTTRGRKSGHEFTTPIVYEADGGRLLVYASNGGAHEHPDWYLNLVADPNVMVEVGTDRYEAKAVPLEGAERDRAWAEHAARWPHFADYQTRAGDRTIPVVAITRR